VSERVVAEPEGSVRSTHARRLELVWHPPASPPPQRPIAELQVGHDTANGFARGPLPERIRIADPGPGREMRDEYIGCGHRGLAVQARDHFRHEPLRVRGREIAARPHQLMRAETGKTPEERPTS